jgi:hypothetical protein
MRSFICGGLVKTEFWKRSEPNLFYFIRKARAIKDAANGNCSWDWKNDFRKIIGKGKMDKGSYFLSFFVLFMLGILRILMREA